MGKDTSNISRQEIWAYLEQNRDATNKELYREFPAADHNRIRGIRSDFLKVCLLSQLNKEAATLLKSELTDGSAIEFSDVEDLKISDYGLELDGSEARLRLYFSGYLIDSADRNPVLSEEIVNALEIVEQKLNDYLANKTVKLQVSCC